MKTWHVIVLVIVVLFLVAYGFVDLIESAISHAAHTALVNP